MEILGKALYLLLIIVFMRFFYFVLRKSFEDKNSTTVKMATRDIVLSIYTIAILSLFAIAIFIPAVGMTKRALAGVVAILMSIYFGIIVKKYIKKLPKNYNLPNIMMTTYFAYYHEKLCFREISFKPRQGGVNSINIKKIIKIGWNALRDFRKLKKQM